MGKYKNKEEQQETFYDEYAYGYEFEKERQREKYETKKKKKKEYIRKRKIDKYED